MKTLPSTIGVLVALAATLSAADDFTGIKEVRLIHGDLGSPKAKTVVITDKAKIEKLVATIKLEKKVPCACDHIQHAVFVKEKGEISVSLCDHCFDIGKATYRMPPEFYKLYTAYWQEGSATQPAEPPKPVDEEKTATAEVVVRGTPAPDTAGPGRGGWPTYTMTVAQVFKTPKDVKIEVGQKLTVKTIKELTGTVTLYLVFDKDQKLYRLQDPFGERGFSHVEAVGGKLTFDTYSGYFVSNKFEPDAADSFLVVTDQEGVDKVFGVAFVMGDKAHRLAKDAFKTFVVVAAIKRGKAVVEFKVEGVTLKEGVVEIRYTTTEKKSGTATFACPLIVSIPRGEYKAAQFVENGKPVKKVEVGKESEAKAEKAETQRHEVFFSGHVQGVGFRQTTATLAEKFAVTGFVKNLPDGRVQLVVEGQPKEIEAFLAAIRKTMGENISKTEEKTNPPTGEFQGFGIRL